MNDFRSPVSQGELDAMRSNGRPLFNLGTVVATPAVLRYLEAAGCLPAALLSRHQHGEWGNLDEEDRKANDRAVIDGSRILSCYEQGRRIYVITEAVGDDGVRASTCLLFPEEY